MKRLANWILHQASIGCEWLLDQVELPLARREFRTEAGVQDTYSRPPEPEYRRRIRRMDERIARRMAGGR